ncbi:MAG TPA: vanadium-dependent haloperoxidase [Vicinamibacterales bacterium]
MTARFRLKYLFVALSVTSCLLLNSRPTFAQGSADVIVEWSRVTVAALAVPGALPPTVFITRPLAMVHVAMFDALNSIDPQYSPYFVQVTVRGNTSRDVAVAKAARDVLAAAMPAQTATFDAALAATTARVADAAAVANGIAVGAEAARATIAGRANDGWNRPSIPYSNPALPGYWQPTPPANAPAAFAHYSDVQGFVIPSATRYRPEAPPALTSARYAADFNEVKAIGSATSTTRTPAETAIAQTWAAVNNTTNANLAWQVAMQDLVRTRNMNGLDAARMFALVNMVGHDALWVSFSAKFVYGLWRPVTAVREAGSDGNAATDADASWLPLLPTPPYPSYPGNMACFGISQAQALTRIFGRDDVPVTITWTAPAGGTNIVRTYNGFRQISDEEARSRILGGIHFTFENLASIGTCLPIADYGVDNYLRKR